MSDHILKIRSLKTYFQNRQGITKAVDGIDLEISRGETLALVGESGCGKTVTALSIFRLIPPPGKIVSGTIDFEGCNLLALSEREMNRLRGRQMGLILQDAMSALNPVMRIGEQISEVFRYHFRVSRARAKEHILDLMQQVRLPNPERLYRAFPHEMSGGQRQRVLIAIALAGKPSLVVADEPTTALDVSIQSEILALLQQLKMKFNLSMLLITHDLAIVAQMADNVAVMFDGKIVEKAPTRKLLQQPLQPYTRVLLDSVPRLDKPPGFTPPLIVVRSVSQTATNPFHGCSYYPRCSEGDTVCTGSVPELKRVSEGRYVRCIKREKSNES